MPARAAHVYYSAEMGQNLYATTVTPSAEGYSYLPMTDGGTATAHFQGAIYPLTATATGGSVRIWYETPDTTAGVRCSWTVVTGVAATGYASTAANMLPITTDGVNTNITNVPGSPQTHSATSRYVTPSVGSYVPRDAGTNALCTGTACQGRPLAAMVYLNNGQTTASSCRFVAIDFDIQ